ncbi:HEAT repeat domain-containing protein [Halocatena marina]|uniref:HEAT repeat domain-containing protein n=1 Tax=Halocatena marina TaxID=2934937 RepID=UPI00200CC995|nr:HEAT repeat domain-containing protein [Halocatena marina]
MTETAEIEDAVRIPENKDGTATERKMALETLKEYSSKHPDAIVPYIDVIASLADSEEHDICHDVALIFRKIANHDPSAVAPYTKSIYTLLTDDDPFVLSSTVLTTMFVTRESPTVLSATTDRLLELLTYENAGATGPAANVRGKAAATLGNMGIANPIVAARADESLADLFDDPDQDVRAIAVLALTRLGLAHPESVETALTHLPAQLDDETSDVRRNAIRAYTLFRRDKPDAIIKPDIVAPAFERAIEQAELDSTETSGIDEVCEYIERIMTNKGCVIT